jgi:hypothetical protein
VIKVTEEIREAARKALQNPGLKIDRSDRDRLTAVSEGKRKQIDALWWKEIHRVVGRSKLDKLAEMADPARNPNEHERAVAADKLKAFNGRRPPGLRPEPPPFPTDWTRRTPRKKHGDVNAKAGAGGVNTKAEIGRGGVNTNESARTKPKRKGDRHLIKSDRHSPGYMRNYMSQCRARLAGGGSTGKGRVAERPKE